MLTAAYIVRADRFLTMLYLRLSRPFPSPNEAFPRRSGRRRARALLVGASLCALLAGCGTTIREALRPDNTYGFTPFDRHRERAKRFAPDALATLDSLADETLDRESEHGFNCVTSYIEARGYLAEPPEDVARELRLQKQPSTRIEGGHSNEQDGASEALGACFKACASASGVKKYTAFATETRAACERLAAEHPLEGRVAKRHEEAERKELERLIAELEGHERAGRVKRFFDAVDSHPRPRNAAKSNAVAELRARFDAIVSRNQDKRALLIRYRDDPEIQRLDAEERALEREASLLEPLLRRANEDAQRFAPRQSYSYITGGSTRSDGVPEFYERARQRVDELSSVQRRIDVRLQEIRARRDERTAELGL